VFDIGFGELLLVMIIGLVVLGPERLPVAVKTVAGWIRTLRSLASSVQNELSQELKLQELQESLKKAEKAGLQNLAPELKASMDELKAAAESLKRAYHSDTHDPLKSSEDPQLGDPEALHDEIAEAERARSPSPKKAADPVMPENASAVEQPSATQPSPKPAVNDASAPQQPGGER
jgi:sec-independent protein translocase protein TatB